MLQRGILTDISHIEGRDFYPELAEVGKEFAERREGVYWK
jgi:hypothetical protein